MSCRRRRDGGLLAFVVIFAIPQLVIAQPATRPSLQPKLDEAVSRGFDYLARQQNGDGSFSPGKGPDGTPGTAAAPPASATGLALLAFLSAGHAPDVGRHGAVVREAVDYLAGKVPESGYVGAPQDLKGDGSGMTGQGIVTLALAQAYGVEPDRERRLRVRAALVKLTGVILAAQAVQKSEIHSGGWRHAPDATDSDLTVTGWNALALLACRDVGLDVPDEALARALQYVAKCRNPVDKGFANQPAQPSQPAATGIAIVLLELLGDGESVMLPDARKFLAQSAGTAPPARVSYVPMYVSVLGAELSGGAVWEAVSRPTLEGLLAAQAPDGGWPASAAPEEPGRAYATALAVLTLSVPNRLLPVVQR